MGKKAYPRGLKPPICCWLERPRAEALGYPEAMAKCKCKGKCTAEYRDLSTAAAKAPPSVEMTFAAG
jgi:hypothetical protein